MLNNKEEKKGKMWDYILDLFLSKSDSKIYTVTIVTQTDDYRY